MKAERQLGSLRRVRRALYAALPIQVRAGARYWQIKKTYGNADRWAVERIEAEQLRLLRAIVSHAYETVPGYQRLYREAGVVPSDLRQLSDIRAFPFTSKALLRDNLEEFTSTSIPRSRMRYEATTGSTGIPFGFYQTALNGAKEDAFMHTGWERAGWKLGDRCMVLRGGFVGTRSSFWAFNQKTNDLSLSSYFLGEETYEEYARVIETFHPRNLKAYPSVAVQLSNLIISRGQEGRFPLKAVLLGSESVYPWQRELIQQAFPHARIYSWYGSTEQVILAGMCEHSEKYHMFPFYGFTEILDAEGREVSPGESGELVGTSFWSQATPLIRYRSMDLARRGPGSCTACGRNALVLDELVGRTQEYVYSRDGRPVPLTVIASIHSHIFDALEQFRFYQDAYGKVELRLRPKKTYTKKDGEELLREIRAHLGEGFDVEMVFVGEIPRGAGGKYNFLEQKLSPDREPAGARGAR
jgi:phenylacetate-CoA ligase